jgi:hypothetical protein
MGKKWCKMGFEAGEVVVKIFSNKVRESDPQGTFCVGSDKGTISERTEPCERPIFEADAGPTPN